MHYKQSNVASERGWTRAKTKEIRDALLTEGQHWWKEGATIWWNEEAVTICDLKLNAKDEPEPEVNPYLEGGDEVLDALVVSQHKNPTWVRGRVEGFSADIRIPKKLAGKLVGKRIKVVMVDNDSEMPYYQYIP